MRCLAAVFLLSLLAAFPTASASGECAVHLAGVPVSDGTVVDAPEDGILPYQIASNRSAMHWTVDLHFAGLRIPVLDTDFARDGALQRFGNHSLEAITAYGSGLYDVTGRAELDDGSSCDVAFKLRVPGSPFRSLLGLVAVALLGVGGAGLLGMIAKAAVDANDMRQAIQDFVVASRRAQEEAKAAAEVGSRPDSAANDSPGSTSGDAARARADDGRA